MNKHFLYEDPEIAATVNVAEAEADFLGKQYHSANGIQIELFGANTVTVQISAAPLINIVGSATPEVFTITITNTDTVDALPANSLTIKETIDSAFTVTAVSYTINGTPSTNTITPSNSINYTVPESIPATELLVMTITATV